MERDRKEKKKVRNENLEANGFPERIPGVQNGNVRGRNHLRYLLVQHKKGGNGTGGRARKRVQGKGTFEHAERHERGPLTRKNLR